MPRFGQPRHHFETIGTTMREAAALAEAGAPEGTLVTADEQTQGRGRLGRSWISERGTGLYFSLVLRPPVAPAQALTITLACGLGVARGIGETCGVRCDIRWPNDVLLGGKKIAGILVELTGGPERTGYAIVGAGVNVNQERMPDELGGTAASLRIETGCEWARDILLEAILRRMERYYELFLSGGGAAIREAFLRASSYAYGKNVVVENAPGEDLRGATAGLDERGVLLLRTADGAVRPVVAGSVRPAEEGRE